MNEGIIEKLKNFIQKNPPFDKKGKPEFWGTSKWEEALNKEIPDWKDILKNVDVWKEIKGIKPKRDYDDMLEVILEHAPIEILKEYLISEDYIERNAAYSILTKDNAKKLTSDFWNLLDNDTKIWLISKISEEVLEKHYPRFLKDLDIFLDDPEYFFERMKRHRYISWIHPYILPLVLIEAVLNESLDIIHPLWIKLKATIEEANDLSSMKRIVEIENKFKKRVQQIIEKLRALFPIFQSQYQYTFLSKNVLFDPSLLFDYEKAKKAFNFMREFRTKFNFFIPFSFYKALKEENKLYEIASFFENEKEFSPQEILRMLEEHKRYYTFFEIPQEIYQEKYTYFYRSLREAVEDPHLAEILFEEWVFLQEFSWIVAKSKKAFEKFKEAGAITIEISEKATDKLLRKTLKKNDDDFITTFDKLRALGKWIAVGGSSVTSFLNPVFGTFISFGSGIFLLLDPEN